MSYDDELPSYTVESGKPSHSEMDAKFCARMHAAIAKRLESDAWNQKSQVRSESNRDLRDHTQRAITPPPAMPTPLHILARNMRMRAEEIRALAPDLPDQRVM
jgi:hypothetical protein